MAFIFQTEFSQFYLVEKLKEGEEVKWFISRYTTLLDRGALILFWMSLAEPVKLKERILMELKTKYRFLRPEEEIVAKAIESYIKLRDKNIVYSKLESMRGRKIITDEIAEMAEGDYMMKIAPEFRAIQRESKFRGIYGWGITTVIYGQTPPPAESPLRIDVKCIERWLSKTSVAPIKAYEVLNLNAWYYHPLKFDFAGSNFLVSEEELKELDSIVKRKFPDSQFSKAVNMDLRGERLKPDDFELKSLVAEE